MKVLAKIQLDKDVKLRLFLIDFRRSAFSRFSFISGGHFDVVDLNFEGKIIYKKMYTEVTKEFEMNEDDLVYEKL
jgi:hypothetical protein